MSNEQFARDGFKAARTALSPFKSSNKVRATEHHQKRKLKANSLIEKYRAGNKYAAEIVGLQGDEKIASIVLDNAKAAKEAGAGNCLEYATIARNYILGQDKDAKIAVIGLDMADHAFLAVGIGSDAAPVKDMTAWDKDIWICDPWANIVCKAVMYPTEWQEKLKKWKGKSKYLSMPNGSLVEATSKTWWLAIEKSNKVPIRL